MREADDASTTATNFADVADLRTRQLVGVELVDDNRVRAAQIVGRTQARHRRAEQRSRVATDHQHVLEPAVRQRHDAVADEVGLGPLDAFNRANSIDQAARHVLWKVDVVHFLVANPDVRVTLVDEQAGFANQAEEQSALDIDEHDRKDDARPAPSRVFPDRRSAF